MNPKKNMVANNVTLYRLSWYCQLAVVCSESLNVHVPSSCVANGL